MAALVTGLASALYVSQRLETYLDYLRHLPADEPSSRELEKTLSRLCACVLTFLIKAEATYDKRDKSTTKHLLRSFWDKTELADFEPQCEKLATRARHDADNCDRLLAVRHRQWSTEWNVNLNARLDRLADAQEHLNVADIRHNLDKLRTAEGAMYGSHADEYLANCLEGTRKELICEIQSWIWTQDPDTRKIFWLHGMAGTGKSTISRTIAEACIKDPRSSSLFATFFFKRGGGDRANARRFFPTLALQLADNSPIMRTSIAKAVAARSSLSEAKLREQFEQLLIAPLRDVSEHSSFTLTVIVIIDALDECDDDNDVAMIITLLMRLAQTTFNHLEIRVYVTSRLETPIQHEFRRVDNRFLHQDMRLEVVQNYTIERDIAIYLKHSFDTIRNDEDLPDDWPGSCVIDTLTKLASPLFIFAATMCRYVAGEKSHSIGAPPRERLEFLLERRKDRTLGGVDNMYHAILNQVFPAEEPYGRDEGLTFFKKVLCPIVLLADPLPLASLSVLFEISSGDLFRNLQQLQSVLQIPDSISDPFPVQPLHASFADYLLKPGKNTDRLSVNESEIHTWLARQCLRLLSREQVLKRDICEVQTPGTRRLKTLAGQISKYIPAHVAYACSYWAYHAIASKCKTFFFDGGEIHGFFETKFLHWLEAASWCGRLSQISGYINELREQVQYDTGGQLLTFLDDASRFVLKYRYIIDIAPLQLYHSALRFAPLQSVIRKMFEAELTALTDVEIFSEPASEWDAEVQHLEGHSCTIVNSVFSQDGKHILSAGIDGSITLWDARTGEEQYTRPGKKIIGESIGTVALSRHNQTIALAYDDNKVILLDARTGRSINNLMVQANGRSVVDSIDFSPKSDLIAVGGILDHVQIWACDTGQMVQRFHTHGIGITEVAFSPDASILACSMYDFNIRLIGVRNPLDRDFIERVEFSPNGEVVATSDAGYDLWDIHSGKRIHRIRHAGGRGFQGMYCPGLTIFSPDGTILLLVRNGRIQLLDSRTARIVQSLPRSDGRITCAIFAKDGGMLASVAENDNTSQTLQLWDVALGKQRFTRIQTCIDCRAMAFSSNRDMLAALFIEKSSIGQSGQNISLVRLLDTCTGNELQTIIASGLKLTGLTFSPDGGLLASLMRTLELQVPGVVLYDTKTGKEVQRLLIDSLMEYSLSKISLAPHGEMIAVAAQISTHSAVKGAIELWHLPTVSRLLQFPIYKAIDSLVFDDDGKSVRTDGGVFKLQLTKGSLPAMDATRTTAELTLADQWIQKNGQDVLWLPLELRPSSEDVWAVCDRTIAIGHRSGTVSFFRFPSA
ncbi:hypothetical protein K461DRAFT_261086 [Myriangium duriaei CBS 260.36]|uniref:NACHT domain-containing protein n=1 Tax=Myriangium duriaei CBS 260.36 TaxID=1168546 RepID=A0A9P4IZ77_9PEZI|nr:hypothetical protein K461DRAFT_261086 [Myriangium duriaei CBS 260.36]